MFDARDILIKTMATVFLNPADLTRDGRKIFIQQFLGCGCPNEVVEQAQIRFFSRPLDTFFKKGMEEVPASASLTPWEKKVNPLLKLPKTFTWPRTTQKKLKIPSRWRRPDIDNVVKNKKQKTTLTHLQKMCHALVDVVIEVPGRAFFFIVVETGKAFRKDTLRIQYESGQLLYQLMGYNRCRLFTISSKSGPKRIPEIDTALTWKGVYDVFDKVKDTYPFAESILDLF